MAAKIPLRIEVRPLLTYGGIGWSEKEIFIYLADDLAGSQAAHALWHEIVHLLMSAGGHEDHDEVKIDALADRLAAACPEVLELCGVDKKFSGAIAQ